MFFLSFWNLMINFIAEYCEFTVILLFILIFSINKTESIFSIKLKKPEFSIINTYN